MNLIINENEHPDWDDYRDGSLDLKKAHAFEAYLDEHADARDRYDRETEMLSELTALDCQSSFATSDREFVSRVMASLETEQRPSVLAKINRYLMPFAAAAAIALVIIVGQSGFLEPQEVTDARDFPIAVMTRVLTKQVASHRDFSDRLSVDVDKAVRGNWVVDLVGRDDEEDTEINFDKTFDFNGYSLGIDRCKT